MPGTTVRSVRRGELDELLALYRQLNPDGPELDPDEISQQWETLLADETVEILVVEHDGRLVATCLLSITPNLTRGARPFALVENVVTHEDYRSRGFGTRCLEAATEQAADRGCYKMMLLTGTDQEWKAEFYEECGFDRDRKTGFEMNLR